ncbi:hypothetical protein BJ508DRAFT_358524 [Ascobolus immersus RN42]|uniref:F-box domain-containing protein n=1 Tax=Ascobolus immersus RN42 TaxID=1160509 RepID=A0A3N4IIK7_ASCIM|nr:hypothetical protein BJ508DRAFT_358524 [Ascobolus immersus RN42]
MYNNNTLVHESLPQGSTSRSFANVPPEIRLEIYRQCSAFTLLVLSATSASLRAELLQNPHIYQQAAGYKFRSSTHRRAWWWDPKLPHTSELSIRHVKKLTCTSELELLKKLFKKVPLTGWPSPFIHQSKHTTSCPNVFPLSTSHHQQSSHLQSLHYKTPLESKDQPTQRNILPQPGSPSSAMSSQDPYEVPPQTSESTIYCVPAEIRLEIYRQCSAFTLLVLTATAKFFRVEILGNTAIVRRSPGFAAQPHDWWSNNVDAQLGEWRFSMRNIERLTSDSERNLLQSFFKWHLKVNSPAPELERLQYRLLVDRCYGCCVGCLRVVEIHIFMRYNMWWGRRWSEYCPAQNCAPVWVFPLASMQYATWLPADINL